jgi:hypothetical protein
MKHLLAHAMHEIQDLAIDLAKAGTPEALALRSRHLNGEFDASREESDAWVSLFLGLILGRRR